MKREWWHSLTVYQIYTRSFCDSNGDGIGDFGGILQKLDYLQELGVGAIWLSPFNDSPNYDNGYDVSDYYKVMEEAGTMEELEELIAACEKREIVVMMDRRSSRQKAAEHSLEEAPGNGCRRFRNIIITVSV